VRLTGCDLAFFLRNDGAVYSPTARATPEGLQNGCRRRPHYPKIARKSKECINLSRHRDTG
jgi:hypothetical protein